MEGTPVGLLRQPLVRSALDAAQASTDAWEVMFAKSRVVRRDVPLGFEPGDYADDDYDAVADYLAPLEATASRAPASRSGLRWCHHGDAVLFELARVLNAPYDEFVARVDIASAIRLMNDYIGGNSVVVTRDEQGRVTRQAERNMYLPQPNWLAFSGGAFIDVCKLEVVAYREGWRRIAWRTVHSPNGSAVHDDGTVTFRREGDQRTRVTVRGLQQFTLPPFWAAAEPWLVPAVKDQLVEESYRRFFTSTLDNFEACYEGRDFRVGRDRAPEDDEPLEQRLRQTWGVMRAVLPDRPLESLLRARQKRARPSPDLVDEDGFQHFSGNGRPAARSGER